MGRSLLLGIQVESLWGRQVWSQGSQEISTIIFEAQDLLNHPWTHSQNKDAYARNCHGQDRVGRRGKTAF